MNKRVFYFIYLWLIFFIYLAGTVQIQNSSLSEFYSDKRAFHNFAINLTNVSAMELLMCHFSLLSLSKKNCEDPSSWEGVLVMAEEAGQNFLEEVGLELKGLVALGLWGKRNRLRRDLKDEHAFMCMQWGKWPNVRGRRGIFKYGSVWWPGCKVGFKNDLTNAIQDKNWVEWMYFFPIFFSSSLIMSVQQRIIHIKDICWAFTAC